MIVGTILVIGVLVGLAAPAQISGQDPVDFESEIWPVFQAKCVTCHGTDGISAFPFVPNLAGQYRDYLFNQLKAFRDGSRKDSQMRLTVRGMTDQEFGEIADFFSGTGPDSSPVSQ